MSKKLFVILNDGETYTTMDGSIMYDAEEHKMYKIIKGEQIVDDSQDNPWAKGIWLIQENEMNIPGVDNDDDESDDDDYDREEDDYFESCGEYFDDDVVGQ